METSQELFEKVTICVIAKNDALLPYYGSEHAAGADVKADLDNDIVIPARSSALIPTGLKVAIPAGYEIQVRPRSGLALNHMITVLNTPGTIDADYRGEVGVILINHSDKDFTVTPGMRIAQMVITRVCQGEFILTDSLDSTRRGEGGFGHTGH